MGQVLHGRATTTEAIRRAIQDSQESLRNLARLPGCRKKNAKLPLRSCRHWNHANDQRQRNRGGAALSPVVARGTGKAQATGSQVGKANDAPERMPVGQREVTVFSLV